MSHCISLKYLVVMVVYWQILGLFYPGMVTMADTRHESDSDVLKAFASSDPALASQARDEIMRRGDKIINDDSYAYVTFAGAPGVKFRVEAGHLFAEVI